MDDTTLKLRARNGANSCFPSVFYASIGTPTGPIALPVASETPLPPPAPTKTLTEEGGSIRQEGKSSDIQAKDDKREPLQIKVPPPRILKARRAMVEVKEARDPLYKTLEPDMSEWESVRLLKKSEVNLEELLRKGSKYEDVTQH
nr:unnamed protein product [Haemonchus contortus]